MKTLSGLIISAALSGLTGCATTGWFNGQVWQQRGDYILITRNDELYLEKLDGSDSRQLTHTPGCAESRARFVGDGKYIVYAEHRTSFDGVPFIIPADGDDSKKKEITLSQFETLQ